MLIFWLFKVQRVDKYYMQGAKEIWNDAAEESCEYREAERIGLDWVSRLFDSKNLLYQQLCRLINILLN